MDLLELSRSVCAPDKDCTECHLVKSQCLYFHYLCDGTDDRGWGCGYRSLQSLCSWVVNNASVNNKKLEIPNLNRIQQTLVEVGDKPHSFVGSREWIGSFEVCIVLDQLYGVPCKIVHVSRGTEVAQHVPTLIEHFKTIGSPVMIGGDIDAASKTLIGISLEPDISKTMFLIADPHYHGPPDAADVLKEGFITWQGLELFEQSSFYNFCLPQT